LNFISFTIKLKKIQRKIRFIKFEGKGKERAIPVLLLPHCEPWCEDTVGGEVVIFCNSSIEHSFLFPLVEEW